MSQEEKNKMMQDMMPKMMGSMMGDAKGSPMGGMMGMMSSMMGGKGGSMMDMMKNMMGGKKGEDGKEEMPWDMCKKMMTNMSDGVEIAKFATPELRGMFDEWLAQIEEEVLNYIKSMDAIDIDKISENFKLSNDSVTYILTRLAQKGKINFKKENE